MRLNVSVKSISFSKCLIIEIGHIIETHGTSVSIGIDRVVYKGVFDYIIKIFESLLLFNLRLDDVRVALWLQGPEELA